MLEKRPYKDGIVVCPGVIFLVNSLVDVTWFWAGTQE